MPYGPCNVCGATNYPSSLGGPYICPSCDCGNFNGGNKNMGFDDAYDNQRLVSKVYSHKIATRKFQERLEEAEILLSRVLKYNELSPGEWVSLILDIVEFNPKGVINEMPKL